MIARGAQKVVAEKGCIMDMRFEMRHKDLVIGARLASDHRPSDTGEDGRQAGEG